MVKARKVFKALRVNVETWVLKAHKVSKVKLAHKAPPAHKARKVTREISARWDHRARKAMRGRKAHKEFLVFKAHKVFPARLDRPAHKATLVLKARRGHKALRECLKDLPSASALAEYKFSLKI